MITKVMILDNEVCSKTRKVIKKLKLHIISYYKTIQVIIFIFSSFVAARIPVHAGFGIDERIGAASGIFPASWRVWLGVGFLLVITILQLKLRTARWPHWSNRLVFIG